MVLVTTHRIRNQRLLLRPLNMILPRVVFVVFLLLANPLEGALGRSILNVSMTLLLTKIQA